MTGPLFTVVIPTYRRRRYLAEAVASVLAPDGPALECIVVDDGGGEVGAMPDDPRLRVVERDANGGSAAARNTGLAVARGRHLVFLDDDDLFVPHRLRMVLPALERAPVAVCWTRFVDGPAKPGRYLEGDVRDVILDDLVPNPGATTVRRDVLVPFDETYRTGEDVEWWLRQAHAATVATVPAIGHLSRRHPGPRGAKGPAERAAAHMRILEDHAEYFVTHRRAAAFRWKRIGLLALNGGDPARARRAFLASLRRRPSARVAAHLARTIVKGAISRSTA